YSPCFDMNELDRPMISFNAFIQLATSDGVVLEYSSDTKNIADPTKDWTRLGEFSLTEPSGVDWYNAQSLASKPGDPDQIGDYGWTGFDNPNWIQPKHILDAIDDPENPSDPPIDISNVVFRFAMASKQQNPVNDGFAIDNVRVGNRTRTILVEHFTNKANPRIEGSVIVEKRESDQLRIFNPGGIGTELIKVNYHVGFPGTDPFNQDNPADPSSRALYYNISETPLTRLDGFKNPGPNEAFFTNWGDGQYGIRTLQLAQAEINFDVDEAADGSLEVNVEVTAKVELEANTVLHIGILEKQIARTALSSTQSDMIVTNEDQFDYVLKKMLPSALGTRFNTVVPVGQVETFGPFNWYPEKARMYGPNDDLAVVVFLQNEDTREILQSEIKEDIADPPLVTGINRDINSIEHVAIYPNPADDEITVELPSPAANKMRLQIASQIGVIANETVFEPGEQTKTIRTKDLAAGIYFLQLGNGQTATRKKVMIVHK
ncbi:MAG: T9SS type A sorting domain-containing protein, partial [Cyclobacteriaceae bacterium]